MLRSGFMRPITDHRKQYLPIWLPIPIFFKSCYHVELFIVMIQSRFLYIYSGPELHVWKWIPLLGNSCERGFFFYYLRGGGYFNYLYFIYQKYIFISPERLIVHYIFVLTIVQLLHNSLHTAQAWFHELYVRWAFYTRFTHTPFAVRKQSM